MARGKRREIVYTGKALKAHEKVLKLETELKVAKEERNNLYKEQIKAEKAAEVKAKKEAAAAERKLFKEKQSDLMKALKTSGKTMDDLIAMLKVTEG